MIGGSCLCGAVRFELARAVTPIWMCHCSRCRKDSGAASTASFLVPRAELRWLAGEDRIRTYAHTEIFRTTFCTTCGSRLPQLHASGGAYMVPAGAVDGDPGVAVGSHIFVGSKAAWDEIGGDAPRFDEGMS